MKIKTKLPSKLILEPWKTKAKDLPKETGAGWIVIIRDKKGNELSAYAEFIYDRHGKANFSRWDVSGQNGVWCFARGSEINGFEVIAWTRVAKCEYENKSNIRRKL